MCVLDYSEINPVQYGNEKKKFLLDTDLEESIQAARLVVYATITNNSVLKTAYRYSVGKSPTYNAPYGYSVGKSPPTMLL